MGAILSRLRSTGGGGEEELDRNVEEEIARNLWANHRMIPPESKFKRNWNTMIVALVIYNTLFIILVVCFNKYEMNTGLYWYEGNTGTLNVAPMFVDYLVDLVFLADIALTFRTTFFDSENELVLDKRVIRMNYLKTWFFPDLISVFPFELFGLFLTPARLIIPLKVVRLLRLTKVVKEVNVHNNVVRVSQMLSLFLVFAHIVGSIWWSLGVASFNCDTVGGRPTGTSWVVRAGVVVGCGDSQLSANTTETGEGLGLEYMSSLYWSLTTLIKTPWVHPDTIVEKVFASFIVVVGAILFAAILGNITAMINSFDKSNAQLRDIMSTLHRLIGKYDVPAKLQKRVFMYVQTQWSTTKGLDNQRILSKIPPALRGDILEAIHADLVQSSPIFQRVSHECCRVMLSKLRSEVCLAKETLLAPGQLCSEVYLLVRGVLQGQPGDGGADKKRGGFKGKLAFRAIEKTGALIGMRDPFEKDFRYPFHVVSVKQAQMVALSAKDLLEVFAMDNRADIEGICEVLEKEFSDIQQALVKGQDATGARRSSAGNRRRSSHQFSTGALGTPLSDHEEVHQRVSVIEETLGMCESEVRSIQEHLQLLPQLCELLNIPMTTLSDPHPAAAQ